MVKEYIDREALMEEIRSLQVTVTGLRSGKGVLNKYARFYRDSVERAIVEAPAANVVEVVRCGQCKYWKINPNNLRGGYCRYCEGASIDHFCSYGERKEK